MFSSKISKFTFFNLSSYYNKIFFFVCEAYLRSNLKMPLKLSKDYLVTLLYTYNVFYQNQPVRLLRLGKKNDGGYVVPEKALEKADVLLGYGISDDIEFEEQFSSIYNKNSYAFDGGITNIEIKNKLVNFIPECIASDKFLYGNQVSSNLVSSFSQQIKKLNLTGKKIFIKMDIEGAEYEAFEDILLHTNSITGIVFELHFTNDEMIRMACNLLKNLKRDFILLHVHGNNFASDFFSSKRAKGKIPRVLELTYINKNLIDYFRLASKQSYPLPIDMPNNPDCKDVEFELL